MNEPNPWALAILGAAATMAGAAGVGFVRAWAGRRKILDLPNERSSHTRPTPRGGGLAVVAVVTIGAVAALAGGLFGTVPVLVPFGVGALLVAGVSWLDDLRRLPVPVRLATHAAAAILALAGIAAGRGASPAGRASLVGFAAVAFLWVVGLTNAYNFMDGIDGIAGTQAVIAGAAWTGWGWYAGDALAAAVGVLVCGSSLGFLVHNWPPAKIFMGDVGSAFLGFVLAVLAVRAGAADVRLAVAGLLAVWPFVFDTAFTLCRRLARRENVFRSHRSHLYQRLVIAGWSHRAVTLLYGALAVAGVGAGWLGVVGARGASYAIAAVPVAGAACLLGMVALVERRRVELRSQGPA